MVISANDIGRAAVVLRSLIDRLLIDLDVGEADRLAEWWDRVPDSLYLRGYGDPPALKAWLSHPPPPAVIARPVARLDGMVRERLVSLGEE